MMYIALFELPVVVDVPLCRLVVDVDPMVVVDVDDETTFDDEDVEPTVVVDDEETMVVDMQDDGYCTPLTSGN